MTNSLMRRVLIGTAVRALKYAGIPLRDPALRVIFGRNESTSGVDVNEDTALGISAVWSAINLISSTVGMMPMKLVEKEPGVKADGGLKHHIAAHLVGVAPNKYATPIVFHQTSQSHVLTHGNAYQEIVRQGGTPIGLRTLLPNQTVPDWSGDDLVYMTMDTDNQFAGQPRKLEPADVIHVPGLGFDGTLGYSPIHYARESMGLGIATEQFGASFFGRGAIPGGVLQHPGELTKEAADNLAKDFESRHRGPGQGNRIAVLEEGMKYQAVGIPPEDAQFLATRQFQVIEVARWFRVPPHMLYDMTQATFASVELQGMDFLIYTLLPWLTKWQQEYGRKLLTEVEQEKYCFIHDASVLLQPDMAARFNVYQTARNMGIFTLNDIYRRERMPLLPPDVGEQRIAPSTMKTLGIADPTTPVDMNVLTMAIDVVSTKLGGVPDVATATEVLNAAVPHATPKLVESIIATLKTAGKVK